MYRQMKVCALGYGDVSTNEGMCFEGMCFGIW